MTLHVPEDKTTNTRLDWDLVRRAISTAGLPPPSSLKEDPTIQGWFGRATESMLCRRLTLPDGWPEKTDPERAFVWAGRPCICRPPLTALHVTRLYPYLLSETLPDLWSDPAVRDLLREALVLLQDESGEPDIGTRKWLERWTNMVCGISVSKYSWIRTWPSVVPAIVAQARRLFERLAEHPTTLYADTDCILYAMHPNGVRSQFEKVLREPGQPKLPLFKIVSYAAVSIHGKKKLLVVEEGNNFKLHL